MQPQADSGDNYLSFTIDLDTGIVSRGVWLCIAQLPPRSEQDIASDATCLQNVEVLREILGAAAGQQRPLLQQHSQPNQLPVLVCPEYAFGSKDWTGVDELVNAFPGPLVLIAGFGQSRLKGLESIRTSASHQGVLLRHGWNDEPDDGGRAMNFGCVWVKKLDASREAVLFGKNFLEAQHEDLNGLHKFNHLTEIVFNDLRLLPFICADALETPRPGAGATVTRRLANKIIGDDKPALCVGALLQCSKQASEKWVMAIDRLLHEFGEARVALIIANVASPAYDCRSGGTDWRNLSGIYVSKRKRANGQNRAQESTGYFESATLMAWPLRSTLPQLAFGTVSLPPYTTDSGVLHPWNASPVRPRYAVCCEQSPRIRKYERSGLQDELLLLSEVTGWKVDDDPLHFQHVSKYVQAESDESANALVSCLLDGPLLPKPRPRRASDLCKMSLETLGQCLSCLDAIMEGSGHAASVEVTFSWAPRPSTVGEVLRLGTAPRLVALWWSIEKSTAEMLAELRQRAENYTGTVLRVFGKGRDGDIEAESWTDMCVDTTDVTVVPDTADESGRLYSDLSTSDATSVGHAVKPRGFQPLMKLAQLRCEGDKEKFMKGYIHLVSIVQS